MRTILLTALCAITIGTQAKVANDTIDKYIIDKQPVEHFDGSQLEGKCISKYMIAYKQGKGVVERHHVIYTGDENEKTFTIEGDANAILSKVEHLVNEKNFTIEGDADGPIVVSKALGALVIIDGEEMTHEGLSMIKSEDIAHVEVIKDTDLAAKQWGSKGVNGVIIVTTKNANETKAVEPLIIVDGGEVSQKEFEKINPKDIDHIEVIKNGSKAAEQWGSRGLNGVIIVTTKAYESTEESKFNISKYLIIVDGQETPLEEFNKMKPESSAEYAENFASMEIFKPGSKEAKSYGEKGHNGVIIVKTKGGKESK